MLTIACANMANLLLAQSVARRTRAGACGCRSARARWQLVRQLLVESVMLSMIGAAGGPVASPPGAAARWWRCSRTRTNTVALDLSMDWRVFAFTAGVGVADRACCSASRPRLRGTGAGAGRTPCAITHAASSAAAAIERRATDWSRCKSRLSFVLVFGSTLFVRTLVGLTSQGMGFESERVLIAHRRSARASAFAKASADRPRIVTGPSGDLPAGARCGGRRCRASKTRPRYVRDAGRPAAPGACVSDGPGDSTRAEQRAQLAVQRQ